MIKKLGELVGQLIVWEIFQLVAILQTQTVSSEMVPLYLEW